MFNLICHPFFFEVGIPCTSPIQHGFVDLRLAQSWTSDGLGWQSHGFPASIFQRTDPLSLPVDGAREVRVLLGVSAAGPMSTKVIQSPSKAGLLTLQPVHVWVTTRLMSGITSLLHDES